MNFVVFFWCYKWCNIVSFYMYDYDFFFSFVFEKFMFVNVEFINIKIIVYIFVLRNELVLFVNIIDFKIRLWF